MGSETKNGAAAPLSPGMKKMVQSLKEIVNCPEPEIYSVLKDCNMDPNEAVQRLLSLGFHATTFFLYQLYLKIKKDFDAFVLRKE